MRIGTSGEVSRSGTRLDRRRGPLSEGTDGSDADPLLIAFAAVEAKRRYPSPLKDLAARYLGIEGIINFGVSTRSTVARPRPIT